MLRLFFTMIAIGLASGSMRADEVQRLCQDNTAFAVDLYHQLSGKEGNLFFSPYSISTALAMTHAGARGETATQMAQALHFSLSQDKLSGVFADLQSHLAEVQGEDKVTLAVANSIWPSDRYKLLDHYIGLLKSDYGVAVTPLDYSKTEAARGTINQWVESKTQDKIKDIIGQGILTPDTELTLVNAIYFYGKWQKPFQSKDTFAGNFQISPGHGEDVPMMNQKGAFSYADLGAVQLLELPYQGGELSMLIVLPKSSGGLKEIEVGLSPEILSKWRSKLAPTQVRMLLPKFKITWGENLNVPLQALGMRDAFDAKADFSGIDGNPHGLSIGLVIHKAFVDVKEEGTEAAAATVVVLPGAVAPVGPLFAADHPFLFLIQEKKTGSILFMGRVNDPKAD